MSFDNISTDDLPTLGAVVFPLLNNLREYPYIAYQPTTDELSSDEVLRLLAKLAAEHSHLINICSSHSQEPCGSYCDVVITNVLNLVVAVLPLLSFSQAQLLHLKTAHTCYLLNQVGGQFSYMMPEEYFLEAWNGINILAL